MIRLTAFGAALVFAATACGGGSAKTVPNLVGERLNVAEDTLDDAGFRYEAIGGGALGIVVRSRWTVCSQQPRPGTRAKEVTLHVARSCGGAAPGVTVVPDVIGESLEDAEERLDEVGLLYTVVGGGEHGVIVKHFWEVCDQSPEPGASALSVELYIARDCWDDD